MLELAAPLLQAPGTTELILVLVLLIIVGSFALWVGIAYWVYKDAEKRNNDNPLLWAAIVFFVGVPGAIVWLLVREDL